MSNDKKNQSKNAQTQQNKPVEDSVRFNPGPSSGIRSSLLSAQVGSKPSSGEELFGVTQSQPVQPAQANDLVTTKKINSKLAGLVAILTLLFLAGAGLFFAYTAYRTSFKKIQSSKL